jgi:hypothetical protein
MDINIINDVICMLSDEWVTSILLDDEEDEGKEEEEEGYQ